MWKGGREGRREGGGGKGGEREGGREGGRVNYMYIFIEEKLSRTLSVAESAFRAL